MSIERTVSDLIATFPSVSVTGTPDRVIAHITCDSRSCRDKSLYIAIRGDTVDGHQFIDQAIDAGATVILHSKRLSSYRSDATYLRTDNSRRAMSAVSAWFYSTDTNPVKVIGVTGTDGKSSTCYFLYQLLGALGIRVSILSTVYYDDGSGIVPNPTRMTTPEAPLLHEFLYRSWEHNVRFAILEASSHALSFRTMRMADIHFHAGICTTITSEHLDFHKTIDNYINDKLQLFRQLDGPDAFGVYEYRSQFESLFRDSTDAQLVTFSTTYPEAQLYIDTTIPGETHTITYSQRAKKQYLHAHIPFSQDFFLYDAAAALAAVLRLLPNATSALERALQHLQLPEGRCHTISKFGRVCIIDYAHTVDAFSKLFAHYSKYYPKSSCITVFGAAGERDHRKRAPMGKLAVQFNRLVIVTDEDPRDESPVDIFHAICSDMTPEERSRVVFIEERYRAIETALSRSRPGDVLFFLGKGHEKSIVKHDSTIEWDEVDTVETLMKNIHNLHEEVS